MRSMFLLLIAAASLAACGHPTHEAERPRADDFNCGRVEGQMTCADNAQATRMPSNIRDF